MARRLLTGSIVSLMLLFIGPAALACGGLVAPGHAEVLQKATTLAAWHAGYEHYVTGFQFAGAASRFGYIVPLPGVPTRIEKAGNWTLERLEREVNPVRDFLVLDAASAAKSAVQVLQSVKIGALDIKVVRGGGPDVAAWAGANGFDLTPDAPNVLGAYSSRGAVFALARFDRLTAAEKGLIQGQGQVIHFVIPMRAPWIPLRILALGKAPAELVDADLFVLSDHATTFSPAVRTIPGMRVVKAGPASASLLADLRSDRGMAWLPAHGMWLTALNLHAPAGTIHYDLSIDGGAPVAPVAPAVSGTLSQHVPGWIWAASISPLALLALLILMRGRRTRLSPA
jgi:hypothetical protein